MNLLAFLPLAAVLMTNTAAAESETFTNWQRSHAIVEQHMSRIRAERAEQETRQHRQRVEWELRQQRLDRQKLEAEKDRRR